MTDWDTWFRVADLVFAVLGPSAEVVVHDVSRPDSSVVYMAGNVTGRRPGSPATDLLLETLARGAPEGPMVYASEAPDGRRLRSGSLFLRHRGEVYGALCINQDLTDLERLRSALDRALAPAPGTAEPQETFAATPQQAVATAVRRAVGTARRADQLTREERLAVIDQLDRRGVFQLRKAHVQVAAALGVSRFTVYTDLKFVRGRRGAEPGQPAAGMVAGAAPGLSAGDA